MTTPTPDQGALLLPLEPSEDAILIMAEAYWDSSASIRDDPVCCWSSLSRTHKTTVCGDMKLAYVALVKHLEDNQP